MTRGSSSRRRGGSASRERGSSSRGRVVCIQGEGLCIQRSLLLRRDLYLRGRGSAYSGVGKPHHPTPHSAGTRKVGGTHPTGMLSCSNLKFQSGLHWSTHRTRQEFLVVDSGFPGWGRQPQRRILKPIIWQIFFRKLHENE